MPDIHSNTIQMHVACFDEQIQEYKFLVLKRASNIEIYPGLWQVITGEIEKGETAVQAAIREFKEETSLTANDIWTLPFIAEFFNPYSDSFSIAPVFAALVDCSNKVIISKEHDNFEWLGLDAVLKRLVLPSHKQGTQIFYDYILTQKDKSLFKYNGNLE